MHGSDRTNKVTYKLKQPNTRVEDMFEQQITRDIWRDKYALPIEKHPFDTFARVCRGVFARDVEGMTAVHAMQQSHELMCQGLLMPGGRIIAGAGAGRNVTLINCYVLNELQDSMRDTEAGFGIMSTLARSAYTMQMGGGIGVDFSKLRPKGAKVFRVDADASGPLDFMDMWDAMCRTIMSAGYRRGAMMATLRCDHPDIEDFIHAKRQAGRLNMFNVSVLVTDEFMNAVEDNLYWDLTWHGPRMDGEHVEVQERRDGSPTVYVYKRMRARDLWRLILENTYEYSEPGVIFIDRINQMNNLQYCEEISCTNPCGEQPLPPNGACNLAAVNLARCVDHPFSENSGAAINYERIRQTARALVRFTDNVIDVTNYPLEEQRIEETTKRRVGIGVSGLGNMLAMLGQRYGNDNSCLTVESVFKCLRDAVYDASCELAKERGPFELFDKDKFLRRPFVQNLPEEIKQRIAEHGIRNGVLLTVAPTGTTSIMFGNVSSGIEPVFTFSMKRKVLQPDNSFAEYSVEDYGYRVFKKVKGIENDAWDEREYPFMVTTKELDVMDHVRVQAAAQKYVDASISKTINCPEDMSFSAFERVYEEAWAQGCKGCTTYKPSAVRGSVLQDANEETKSSEPLPEQSIADEAETALLQRPEALEGTTYKIKWPHSDAAFYITINELQGVPFEIFISSKNTAHTEWTTALSLMMSAIFRRGGDISFVAEELKAVQSHTQTAWVNSRHYPSLVAYIGHIVEGHLNERGAPPHPQTEEEGSGQDVASIASEDSVTIAVGEADVSEVYINDSVAGLCTKCGAKAVIHQESCDTCANCGHSNCG